MSLLKGRLPVKDLFERFVQERRYLSLRDIHDANRRENHVLVPNAGDRNCNASRTRPRSCEGPLMEGNEILR